MNEKEELDTQIVKHTLMMTKAIASINLKLREPAFKELFNMAKAYYEDSKHFYSQKKLVQSFEALMISWAYLDSGLRLGVFELKNDELKSYFTIE